MANVDNASGTFSNALDFFLSQEKPEHIIAVWLTSLASTPPSAELSLRQWLNFHISEIDQLIEDQLNLIIHHSKFQKLEASWRGLEYLSNEVNQHKKTKIKILNVSWIEVCKDIDRAVEFDQSQLFQHIYNDEFGMPGGEPIGLLLGDYYITHKPSAEHPTDDINALKGMAQIAAAAFAPFVCSAAPQLFGLDDINELAQPIDIESVFRGPEYIRWRALREMEDSRFLAITIPDMLLRTPYTRREVAKHGLNFEEHCRANHNRHYLWGNACVALGAVIAREFKSSGWFSTIRGVHRDHLSGGVVTQLPSLASSAHDSNMHRMSTSVIITESFEKTLSDCGFIALSHCYGTPFSAFLSNSSLQKPQQYNDKGASANARVSAMLQQILCASRFAHYIKVIIRDKIGSFHSESDCEQLLNDWLKPYATGRTDLDWELRARYPLRDFKVQVREQYNKPGSYHCTIHLKPHYIAEQIVSELKLTTELVQSGRAA